MQNHLLDRLFNCLHISRSLPIWGLRLLLGLLFWLTLILTKDIAAQESGTQSQPKQFDITYDLRSCKDGFEVLWHYYMALGSQKGGKIFTSAQRLRRSGTGLGRFPSRKAVPHLDRFAQFLGASPQTFTQLLWRDSGADRAYIFTVQRNLDTYNKLYYPFVVYESFDFPWSTWNQQNSRTSCDKSRLFESIPKPKELSSNQPPTSGSMVAPSTVTTDTQLETLSGSLRSKAVTLAAKTSLDKINPMAAAVPQRIDLNWGNPLPNTALQLTEPNFQLVAQESQAQNPAAAPVVSNIMRAESTVLLEVGSPEQLCQWEHRYGENVIVPAQQIAGSSAWRFRQQSQLPYGLTRLKLYHWGAPQRPYPLAYTNYSEKNYVILASFQNGYRLQYLAQRPQYNKASPTNSNLQITGAVIFWFEPVQQIPEGLSKAAESFPLADDFDSDCRPNAYRRRPFKAETEQNQ